MAVQYDFYANPPSQNRKPRYHARVVTSGTVGTNELAEQIHQRCTVTAADVKAVLSALADVAIAAFRQSKRIHIEGFGFFQITLSCPPVRKPGEIRAESIRFDSVAFRAEQALKDRLRTLPLQRVSRKNHSRKLTAEDIDQRLTNYFSKHQSISRKDFQNFMGFTPSTAGRRLRELVDQQKLRKAGLHHFPVYEPVEGYFGRNVNACE